VLDHIGTQVISHASFVPHRPGQQVLDPIGLGSPACSAILQQFLRGRSASSPSTNALARRRGSTRPNRAATRPSNPSRPTRQQAGSNPYAVASGHRRIFGCAHNTGSSTVAALLYSPGPSQASQATIYGWSTRRRPSHHRLQPDKLVTVLHDQGDLAGARRLHERALVIYEAHRSADLDTAATLNNLAGVLGDQGDLAGARRLHERALAIREAHLGADHPDTAQSRRRLVALTTELEIP
jgi:hypothetical protein